MTFQRSILSTPRGLLIMIYAPFGFCREWKKDLLQAVVSEIEKVKATTQI